MQEFIVNWILQVNKKGLGPYVVGALDGGAVELCESRGFPAVSFGAQRAWGARTGCVARRLRVARRQPDDADHGRVLAY